jgi:hypothetical protein
MSSDLRYESGIDAIRNEMHASDECYGDFASMHEAYGVLAEEFRELEDAVFMRQDNSYRKESIRREAIQIAAVAIRIAEQAGRVTR